MTQVKERFMDIVSVQLAPESLPIIHDLDRGTQLVITIQIAGGAFTLEPYLSSSELAPHRVSTRLLGCPSSGKVEELGKALQFLKQARVHATCSGVAVSPKLLGGSPNEEVTKQLVNACQEGKDELALKLLKENALPKDLKDSKGNPLICWMAQNEMVSTLTFALESGWSPDLPNTGGVYPLHYAAIKSAVLTRALLKASANPFVQTPGGITPGRAASEEGNTEALDQLILILKNAPLLDWARFQKTYQDLKSRLKCLDLKELMVVAETALLLGEKEVLVQLLDRGSWSELMPKLVQEYPISRHELIKVDNYLTSINKNIESGFHSYPSNQRLSDHEILFYGYELFEKGKYKEAVPILLKCLEMPDLKNETALRAELCSFIGDTYESLGEYRKAIEYHEKSLQIFLKLGDLAGVGRAYGNLGNAYFSLGEYCKAIEHHKKLLQIALKLGDSDEEGRAYAGLGNAYDSLGEYRKAIEYYEKCLQIALKRGDPDGEGASYTGLGDAYDSLGEYRKAIEYHEKCLQIALKREDPDGKKRAYTGLGNAYYNLGEYRKAIEYHEKCLQIALKQRDLDGEERAYTGLGNAYLSFGEYRKAIECHENCLRIALKLRDPDGEGKAYAGLGHAYRSLGEYRKAIEYHEKCLQIALKLRGPAEEGRAYASLGNAYFSLGEYRKAIEYHEKHLQIALKLGDPKGEGGAYGNLGTVYQSLGEYRKAIEYHEKCLQIALRLGDPNGEEKAYSNLGIVYQSLGEYRKAIEYYEKCLQIVLKLGDPDGEGRAYTGLGNAHDSLGEYRKAIEYHEKCLQIALKLGDLDGEGRSYGNLGTVYQSLGEYRKAIEYHEKCLQIVLRLGDSAGEGTAYTGLGNAYDSLGEYRKSVEYYEKRLQIALKLGDPDGEGAAYTGLGNAYGSLGEYRKAIEHYEKLLQIALKLGDPDGEGKAYSGLGNVYDSLGEYQKALEYHKRHLQIALKLGDPDGEGKAYGNMAVAYSKLKDFPNAEKNAREAVRVCSSIQHSLPEDSWKITIFEEQSRAYFLLLKALIAQGKQVEAFFVADFGRSRALSDLLSDRTKLTCSAQPVPTPDLQKIDPPFVEGTSQHQFPKMTIEDRAPRSVASPLEHMLTKKDLIQVAVNLKTTVVFYSSDWMEKGVLHAWIVDAKSGISYKKLDASFLLPNKQEGPPLVPNNSSLTPDLLGPVRKSQKLGAAANHLVSELEEASRGGLNMGEGINRDLKLWYKLLIAPLEGILPTEEGSRLTFISDASLGIVPFAALQKEDNSYLVQHYTITTAPSIEVLCKLAEIHNQESNQKKLGKGCVVGDPQENLQWAKQEGLEVASALKADPIIGKNASIEVIQKAISEARWIHFACHGDPSKRTDIHSVYEGALGLAPPTEDPKGGWWHANQIQKIPLSAELVFLSGCDTGKGKIQREGVIGLTRSFLAAGASCVIATQWPIADEATTKLVGNFYRSILSTRKPKKKAEALREMMLEGIHQGMPPEKWAPFFLEGWPE
ncbi:MAG: tetratricopeptide repeat protein [Parachlamydiales bacterium]